jgi:glutamyl-tRNA(Gln) amidotransferase subunit D
LKALEGYRGLALKLLQESGAQIGDLIEVTRDGESLRGFLMPRSEYDDENHVVLKLSSGYNVGLRVGGSVAVRVLEKGVKPMFKRPPRPPPKPGLPEAYVISTGGTIASRVDYRTGGVEPALNAEDLYSIYPELSELANIHTTLLYSEFSENLTKEHWAGMARAVAEAVNSGAQGVVICHGTDTMGYTAAALSFILQHPPIPIILVGSQRSSDRPSSDAPSNLIAALKISLSAPFAGVYIAMHEGSSDEYIAVHRGVKVRKCHTSARDAFKSINASLAARYHALTGTIQVLDDHLPLRREMGEVKLEERMDDNVCLVKFYPGMKPKILESILDSGLRGIILEGSGLGHVSKALYEPIRKAVERGVFVGMTSQCLWGRVNLNVYYTGRDLLKIGVVPLEDMLPETALVKLMWVLGRANSLEEVKELMTRNLVGEISETRWFQGCGP